MYRVFAAHRNRLITEDSPSQARPAAPPLGNYAILLAATCMFAVQMLFDPALFSVVSFCRNGRWPVCLGIFGST
jgi:hypothetical protein